MVGDDYQQAQRNGHPPPPFSHVPSVWRLQPIRYQPVPKAPNPLKLLPNWHPLWIHPPIIWALINLLNASWWALAPTLAIVVEHNNNALRFIMPYTCRFLWWADYLEDFKWRRLHFQFGVPLWRVVLREVYLEGPNHVWRALKTSILNTEHGPTKCP